MLSSVVTCKEFEWERQKLLKRIGDIDSLDIWL